MTLRYAHLSHGHKRNAVKTLDKMLKDRKKSEILLHNFLHNFTPEAPTTNRKSFVDMVELPERG